MLEALLALFVIVAIVFLFIKALVAAPLLVIAVVIAYFVFRKRGNNRL